MLAAVVVDLVPRHPFSDEKAGVVRAVTITEGIEREALHHGTLASGAARPDGRMVNAAPRGECPRPGFSSEPPPRATDCDRPPRVVHPAVLDAERSDPQANITTFGDALWWSVTTVTTVGYGDQYPVTTTGRLVAVGLMLAGIALLGIVTASLATWLLDSVRAVEQEAQAKTHDDLGALALEVAARTWRRRDYCS